MGNEWSTSRLRSCQLEERVEFPVGSTRNSLPWQLYRAVSTDRASGSSLSAFVYPLNTDSGGSDSRQIARSDIMQAAENNAKWLKRLRHPYVVKFREVALFSEEVCVVTEKVTPLQLVIDSLTPIEICSGLYNVVEAISFLHSVACVSHNCVSIDAVYVSESGNWKLGSFESARHFDQITLEFLRTCQPVVSDQTSVKDGLHLGCTADLTGFADLVEYTIEYLSALGDDVPRFHSRLKELLSGDADQQTFCDLLSDHLFRNDFISISCFLQQLPLMLQQEQVDFFRHLVPRLCRLPVDVVGSRLTKLLLSRLVVINPAACTHLMPHLLTPVIGNAQRSESVGSENDDNDAEVCGIFSRSLYSRYVLPELYKIFHVRDALVRTTLLRHFHRYADMFDHTTLSQVIIPQLLLSVRDVDDELVALSLNALATLVPILGGDLVMGQGRQQLFSRGQPKVGDNLPMSNGLLHHVSPSHGHHERRSRVANANTRNQHYEAAHRLRIANVHADHEEHIHLTNNVSDPRQATDNHLSPGRRDSDEKGEKSLTAVDSHQWNDLDDDSDVVNSVGQFRSQMSDASRHSTSLHHSQTGDSVSSRQSSALKLKCNTEPHQEGKVTASHNPVSPSNPTSASALTQFSPTLSAQEQKLPSLPSHSATSRTTSAQNRRTLLNSNEPLGAEFDVKQIKVRRGMSNSTSSGDVDLFADMEPVITSSAQPSLLGLLSAATAETTLDTTAESVIESTSRLNINANHYHLDSAVVDAGDGWNDGDVDWDTIDM